MGIELNNKCIFLLFLICFIFVFNVSCISASDYNSTDLLYENFENEPVLTENTNDSSIVNTYLNSSNVSKYYKGSERYGAYLYDINGTVLPNKNIAFLINGVQYSRTTNNDGYASIAINLNSGNYSVSCFFMGDDYYNSCSSSNWVFVNSTIHANNLVKYYRNSSQYYSLFFTVNGIALANTTVTFNIHGVFYNRTTNSSGWARLNINLEPGEYIITAINPVSGEIHSNNITVLCIIIADDSYMGFQDGSPFEAIVLDDVGNPYSYQNVTFNINGVFYKRISDKYGVARLNIRLMVGEYIITTSFKQASISNKIYVYDTYNNYKSFNFTSSDVNLIYSSKGSYIRAFIKDENNLSVANKSLLLTMGDYSRACLSDDNGCAKWLIDWDTGYYNIKISFKHLKNEIIKNYIINITKSNITIENNSILSQYYNPFIYSARLYDVYNNSLSNTNVSFGIDNNTFYNFTGNDGIVFCMFDLDIGEYYLNISFNGNRNYNPCFIVEKITIMNSVYADETLGFYNQSNLTVNIISNYSSFYYSFDNISWYDAYDNISVLFTQGDWDLYYCNNFTQVYHQNYIIDNTSPIVFSDHGSGIYNKSLNVNLTAIDNVDENPLIYFSLNNNTYTQYNGSIFIPHTSPVNVLRFYSIDKNGHVSDIFTVNYFFGELIANLDTGKYYFNINEAINDNTTHFGDVIEVSCDLNETLYLNKSIHIKSCSFKKIKWFSYNCCIYIVKSGSNSIIEGFNFNSHQNITYIISLANVENCSITNNIFNVNSNGAINSINNKYINFFDNIFNGNSYNYILIQSFAKNYTFYNNNFSGNYSYAIRCFEIENSLFIENKIFHASAYGIYLNGYNNTISYNNFTSNNHAIYLRGSNSRIISNIFHNNNIGISLLNVNGLDIHFNIIALNNCSVYSINHMNVDATNNWWGFNNLTQIKNHINTTNWYNFIIAPFLSFNVYASSYKIDNGVVYGGTICCDLTQNSNAYETSNLGCIPDNMIINFNNESYRIVNGKVYLDTLINDNDFKIYLNDIEYLFSFKNESIAHIIIDSSAIVNDLNETLYFEHNLFLNDSVDWISVVWKNKDIFESEINLIVNGEIINRFNVISSYYMQIQNNVSFNLLNATYEYNKLIENNLENNIANVYVWLALKYNVTNLEEAYYLKKESNWSNFTIKMLNDLLDEYNLTFNDVVLNLIKNSYNLTMEDVLFVRQNHNNFKDNIHINIDYLGDCWEKFNFNNERISNSYYWKGNSISRNAVISFVDGSYAHKTGEISEFVNNWNFTHLSNGTILWRNAYSEGYLRPGEYDGFMTFTFANARIDDNILRYWLNQKDNFTEDFMKASYGSFIEGLIVIYCNDLVADVSALRFNVTWNRTSPMVMSVRDDLYYTILSGECNFHFGRSVYGEIDNVRAFNFACSASFSPIEHYVSQVLFPDSSDLGSVTLGLGYILTHNGTLEIVQEGNYILIRENASDTRVLLYDFSTGLLHDQLIINVAGAYCYSNQQTQWAWQLGEELLNCSSQIMDLIVGGIHDIMDYAPFLDDAPDWLLGIVGSAAICLGVAAIVTTPVGWCIGTALIIGGIYAIYYSNDLNREWTYEKGAWFVFDVASSIPFGVYKSGAIVGEVVLKEYSLKNTKIITKYSDDAFEMLISYYSLTKNSITYEPYGTLKRIITTAYGTTNSFRILGKVIFDAIGSTYIFHPFISNLIDIINNNLLIGTNHV